MLTGLYTPQGVSDVFVLRVSPEKEFKVGWFRFGDVLVVTAFEFVGEFLSKTVSFVLSRSDVDRLEEACIYDEDEFDISLIGQDGRDRDEYVRLHLVTDGETVRVHLLRFGEWNFIIEGVRHKEFYDMVDNMKRTLCRKKFC